MNSKRHLVMLFLLVTGVTTLGFAGPIKAISSQVFMEATSNAGCGDVTNNDGQSQGNTINDLTATASATATCTHPNRRVVSGGKVTAVWNNDSKGAVRFRNVGWDTKNITDGYANPDNGLDYTYTFLAKKDSIFDVNYDITGTGDLGGFGLNGFEVDLNGIGQFLDVNTSGDLIWNLVAGDTYTLLIKNDANIQGALGTISESMDGTFKFSAKLATPEPSSLLLLGSGMLGLAGVVRKKFSR